MIELLSRLRVLHQQITPLAEHAHAPDVAPNYTPYACSYHFFRTPAGQVISLDLIRSDDTGKLGLRVLRERTDGGIDGLAFFAPSQECCPFGYDGELPDGDRSDRGGRQTMLLSRSSRSIAGRVVLPSGSGGIHSVRFALSLQPLEPGFGTGQLGLGISHIVATDFLRVAYRGFVEINDERQAIDSLGTLSLHAGDRLPHYAYAVSVPHSYADGQPAILAAAVHDDALRFLGELMGRHSLVYAYGRNGIPKLSFHLGGFGADIPIGSDARLVLSGLQPFVHDLLGVLTVSAFAQAQYVSGHGPSLDLGRVVIDYRGPEYVDQLRLPRSLLGT